MGSGNRMRIARFALTIVGAAGLAFVAGCSSETQEVLDKPIGGEPVLPVETLEEVAVVADAVVEYTVVDVPEADLEGLPADSPPEGAAPRIATVRIDEVLWQPPGIEQVVRVGDEIVLGAGIVEYSDREVVSRLHSLHQPWLDQGDRFATALVRRNADWLMLPNTTTYLVGDSFTAIDGQERSQYTESLTDASTSEIAKLLDQAVSPTEQATWREMHVDQRMLELARKRVVDDEG